MYTLLSGLWKQFTASNQYNILFLGRGKSGKTFLYHTIKQLTPTHIETPFNVYNDNQPIATPVTQFTNPFENGLSSNPKPTRSTSSSLVKSALLTTKTYTPTIGLNASKAMVQEGVQFQLWDVGGESRLRQLWQHYYLETHAIVFVHDVNCNEDEFNDARNELYKLMTLPALTGVPIALVFNHFPIGINESHPTYRELAMKLGILHILNHFQPQLFPHNNNNDNTEYTNQSNLPISNTPVIIGGEAQTKDELDDLLQFSSLLDDVDTTIDPLSLPISSTFSPQSTATSIHAIQPATIPFGNTIASNAASHNSTTLNFTSTQNPHILPLHENTHLFKVFTINQMNPMQLQTIQSGPILDLVSWLIDTIPQTERAGLLLTG